MIHQTKSIDKHVVSSKGHYAYVLTSQLTVAYCVMYTSDSSSVPSGGNGALWRGYQRERRKRRKRERENEVVSQGKSFIGKLRVL